VAVREGEPAGSEKGPVAEAVRGISGVIIINNGINRIILPRRVLEAIRKAAEGVVVVRRVGARSVLFAGALGTLPRTARTRSKTYGIVPSLKPKTHVIYPDRI
jgi:hypothetical protein